MPGNSPVEKKLICPVCFAKEIDPIFLRFDPEDGGEFYCQECGYTAKTREEVLEFHDDYIRHRHGIKRKSRY